MASAKDIDDFINSLKAKLFQFVELFCTNLQKKSEEEVCSDLILMESICSADMADAVDAQVNNSESCPLLRETLQELRRRVCEPSGSYSPPGRNQPFDSSTSRDWYDWILELFKELLRRLQQKFQKALEWLHQIAAACLQGLRIAAEAVWRVLNDFCSSLEQLALQEPYPGLEAPRGPQGAWPHLDASISPSHRASSDAPFTLLLTLDPSS